MGLASPSQGCFIHPAHAPFLLQEEDEDGSQESKKSDELKKEPDGGKSDVTKAEDEATDYDKENEAKSDGSNEMPDIKTETKTEPEDKAPEDKFETPVVNGESAAAKEEVGDAKKPEIKEDSKPKTEPTEGKPQPQR